MPVNIQQYHEEICVFYNRYSIYTFIKYSFQFHNILILYLFSFIYSCLVFYMVTFAKVLKNCTSSMLKVSINSLHL